MRVPVTDVLFKRVTRSNARALARLERGEYDFRLGSKESLRDFFSSISVTAGSETTRGGWDKTVEFEPFSGARPVPERSARLHYMGPSGARSNDLYFAAQATGAYDLWRPGRAFPTSTAPESLVGDALIIARDVNNRYHARWIRAKDFPALPSGLRTAFDTDGTGVWSVPSTTPSQSLSPAAQEVLDALHAHHNVLLYGPPATGKTHIVREVLQGFIGTGVVIDTAEERRPLTDSANSTHAAWATFHQSYSYEDFIVGLRPDPDSSGGFRLEPVPGVLLELAEWARAPGRSALLVIDEINRGNVSRIFGEFITLLEPDKRLADDGSETSTTVKVRLPYLRPGSSVEVHLPDGSKPVAPSPFSMPLPVYTLATMNSVDKSVAPLDAALRRRFHLINLYPDLSGIQTRLGIDSAVTLDASGVPASLSDAVDIKQLGLVAVAQLNRAITMFLGPDFQFGEWYLAPLLDVTSPAAAKSQLASIWRTSLMPQLEEYFLGRADQLLALLGASAATSGALVVDEPRLEFEELGATRAVRGRKDATDDDVLDLLRGLAAVEL